MIELVDQDRLDSCIWLTEDQLDQLLGETETHTQQTDKNDALQRNRPKRKIENFKTRPDRKWTFPIRYKFDGSHSKYTATLYTIKQ